MLRTAKSTANWRWSLAVRPRMRFGGGARILTELYILQYVADRQVHRQLAVEFGGSPPNALWRWSPHSDRTVYFAICCGPPSPPPIGGGVWRFAPECALAVEPAF